MKKVERYFYPAIFSYEPDQEIAVVFPDLNCATSGLDNNDALLSARELLGCVLNGMEEDGEDIPEPTPLQNITPAGSTRHQELAVALALCGRLLNGRGACRVHGGGFAGTIQAFVPNDMLEDFKTGIESYLGAGCCHILTIRREGGTRERFTEESPDK